MAFTRFHDDPARIRKYANETSYAGRYYLNVPGNGVHMPFQEDVHMRMQKWGTNARTHMRCIESDLFGLTRKYTRDDIASNEYTRHAPNSQPLMYGSHNPFVEESRASHPAWMYRDLGHTRWEEPLVNPQYNAENRLQFGLQTRIMEKDSFVAKVPTFLHLS